MSEQRPYFPEPPPPKATSPFRARGHVAPPPDAPTSDAAPAPAVIVRRVEPVEDRFAPVPPEPTLRKTQPSCPAATRLAAERNPAKPEVEAMSPESRRELARSLVAVAGVKSKMRWQGYLAWGLVLAGLYSWAGWGRGRLGLGGREPFEYWYVLVIVGAALGFVELRRARKQLGLE